MTRIIFHPTEYANYTLESDLPVSKLILAVNRGNWRPPPGLVPSSAPHCGLRAVRLGRQTVLIYPAQELEIPLAAQAGAPLGERQMAVLQCVAEGLTTRQAAARLNISRRSVYMHLAAIRRILSAASTPEAIRRAAELGLCQPQPVKPSG